MTSAGTSGQRLRLRLRLRVVLAVVFIALLVPALVLAWLGYRQLQYESFYTLQANARNLTEEIDGRMTEVFAAVDGRSFADFGFLIVGEGNFLQRSPLSAYPVHGLVPGLVSYFQVDAEGRFSTPLLPADGGSAGLDAADYQARQALQDRVRMLLAGSAPAAAAPLRQSAGVASEVQDRPQTSADSDLLEKKLDSGERELARSPAFEEAEEPVAELSSALPAARSAPVEQAALAEGQRAYQRLNAPKRKTESPLGSVAELQLKESFSEPEFDEAVDRVQAAAEEASGAGGKTELRSRRTESNIALPTVVVSEPADGRLDDALPLTLFESEVEPLRFDLLDADHFVFYRNAWRDQQRYVQGAIVERGAFLAQMITPSFTTSGLGRSGSLVIAHQGEVIATYDETVMRRSAYTGYMPTASQISGTFLYQSRLTAPVNDLELIFGFQRLPAGPGASLIMWTTLAFMLVLAGGFYLLHRVGMSQITLGEQQRDFVSAVSHELKTPLTSIRMYGEMLKAGWASEEKRQEYYEFIFSESERLTRLINNVLRLARFDRNGSDLDLRRTSVGELVDLTRSKIASQIEQAGFVLEESHQNQSLELLADQDAFTQIAINLVDNALKFSASADQKKVVFSSRPLDDRQVEFSVRDFGPGVPKQQMKKIFELFYRTERELTRETVGTGIGLALVNELAAAMGGSVDVRNAEPGAEFRVRLPLIQP